MEVFPIEQKNLEFLSIENDKKPEVHLLLSRKIWSWFTLRMTSPPPTLRRNVINNLSLLHKNKGGVTRKGVHTHRWAKKSQMYTLSSGTGTGHVWCLFSPPFWRLYMAESSCGILHGHSLSHYWECMCHTKRRMLFFVQDQLRPFGTLLNDAAHVANNLCLPHNKWRWLSLKLSCSIVTPNKGSIMRQICNQIVLPRIVLYSDVGSYYYGIGITYW